MRWTVYVLRVMVVSVLLPSSAGAQGTETVVYFHHDAVGSVRMITDGTGQVVERFDHAPFGEPWPAPSPTEGPRFAWSEHDPVTGLNYLSARDLHSATGRFTAVDPGHVGGDIADPQSWNAYAYARNNPFRFVDPDGTDYEIRIFGGDPFTFVGSWAALNQFAAGFTLGNSTWGGDITNAQGVKVGTYWWVPSQDTFADAVRNAGGSFESRLVSRFGPMPTEGVLGASPFMPPIGRVATLAARTLRLLGPGTKLSAKIVGQLAGRGWTPKLVQRVIDRAVHTSPALNRATGNAATAYFDRTGAYVVRDNVTGEIVQVSNRLNPGAWRPDASIVSPFVP